jgi:hypothetical protein
MRNIVNCPICRATLIAEEIQTHKCQPKPFEWFYEGDWLFVNDESGWGAVNFKHPSAEILHAPDLATLRRELDRTISKALVT